MTIVFLVSHFNQKDVSYEDELRFTCALLVQSTLDLVKFLGSRVYFTKSKNFTISNTAKMDNFQNLVEN